MVEDHERLRAKRGGVEWWAVRDSNPRTQGEQIYSLSPLTTWLTAHTNYEIIIAEKRNL